MNSSRNRRAVPDDGVFMSIADVFSLLCITLLAFALFARRPANAFDFGEVPVAFSPDAPAASKRSRSAEWVAGNQCQVKFSELPVVPSSRTFEVPCSPPNFLASPSWPQEYDDLVKLADELRRIEPSQRPDVQIRCPVDESPAKSAERCMNLQLTLLNTGFDPQLLYWRLERLPR